MASRKRNHRQSRTVTAEPQAPVPPPERTLAATTSGLRITPTEPLFVHVGIALPLTNVYPAVSSPYALLACASYVVLAVAAYWAVRRWLRGNGLIERLWQDQVLDPAKNRVSVGTILSLLDHLHIVLVFVGAFLFAVNALYWLEPSKSWVQALYMGLMAFNLKGFDDFAIPQSTSARAVCAALSILSVLFVGFLAAAFLKPFVIVFRHK